MAADPFDVSRLGQGSTTPPAKRSKPPRHKPGEKFLQGPIPWQWIEAAAALPGKALAVALVVWFEAGCGFVLLTDLDATAAERWLAEQRRLPKDKGGFGPASSNHYTKSLKAFGNWLVKSRRVAENPFRYLSRVNAEVDVRHERRALTDEEFTRLLAAARVGKRYRGTGGEDRAALYLVAAMTGLRASELASLTRESFTLDADPPVVAVEAAYSKHRRRDEVPLHRDLVAELRPWLASKQPGQLLWPGKWAKHSEAGDMIRRDLAHARAAWVGESTSAEEKQRRDVSDFLTYRNRDGQVADFHSLRHRFITELVRAGVAPKDAKELARHSTITLTMDRYAHVGVRDTAAALARLTMPSDSRPTQDADALKATGTDGGAGAATGAAEIGEARLRLSTGEDGSPSEGGVSTLTNALKLQTIEDQGGG